MTFADFQHTFDLRPTTQTGASKTIKRFFEFHQANPHVWNLFQRFTFEKINQGFRHFSVVAVCERIRWETAIVTDDPDGFKLNNDFRPAYARMFMEKFPQHKSFFRTRNSIFDGVDFPTD